jgi:amidase
VRIPASNCGIWGWRPSHGFISVAGVMPLAPSLDTVGVFARSADVLRLAAGVLLASSAQSDVSPDRIYIITEAFALADVSAQESMHAAVNALKDVFRNTVVEISLCELCNDARAADLSTWLDTYRMLLGVEVQSSLGSWIAATRPKFGPAAAKGFEFIATLDRSRVGRAIRRRGRFFEGLRTALGANDLLCLPTVPSPAPVKGTNSYDRNSDYYRRTGSLNSIAGLGRLPQVSMPLATVESAPVGLSLLGAYGADLFLIEAARMIDSHWRER